MLVGTDGRLQPWHDRAERRVPRRCNKRSQRKGRQGIRAPRGGAGGRRRGGEGDRALMDRQTRKSPSSPLCARASPLHNTICSLLPHCCCPSPPPPRQSFPYPWPSRRPSRHSAAAPRHSPPYPSRLCASVPITTDRASHWALTQPMRRPTKRIGRILAPPRPPTIHSALAPPPTTQWRPVLLAQHTSQADNPPPQDGATATAWC